MRSTYLKPSLRQTQRGVALFVVLVFVMLSMLLAIWASRTSLFNELVVGNDADYQRAYEAAQALLQDAELDIRGEKADGTVCAPSGKVCRISTALQFPGEAKDITPLINTLDAQPTKCLEALCARRTGRQDFWNYTNATSPAPTALQAGEVPLEQLTVDGIGARYGEYTGASLGDTTNPINPILADRSANNRGGWYWIEVMPYRDTKSKVIVNSGEPEHLQLNLDVYVVYRITALANGIKPGTQVVLQQTYARQRKPD